MSGAGDNVIRLPSRSAPRQADREIEQPDFDGRAAVERIEAEAVAMKQSMFEQAARIDERDRAMVVAHCAVVVLTELFGGPMSAVAAFGDLAASLYEPEVDDDDSGAPGEA